MNEKSVEKSAQIGMNIIGEKRPAPALKCLFVDARGLVSIN